MKNCLFFLLIFSANIVFAQKNVSGIITDKSGNPIFDVRVSVKNANNQTFSDSDGKYSIEIPENCKILEFSKQTFRVQEVEISGNSVNVVLTSIYDVKDIFELSLEELMQVEVVTASRSKKSIKQLPNTIFVISRNEILQNNYMTLVDVLKDLPEIKVSQPGNGVHGETFLMSGLYGNYYTQIMIDGIPIKPSVVDGIPIAEQINMKNVARIEVLYRPASALYGADALAGVINIITFHPNENKTYAEIIKSKDYTATSFFANAVSGENKNRIKFSVSGVFSKSSDENIYSNDTTVFPQYNNSNKINIFNKLPANAHCFNTSVAWRNFSFSYNYMYRNENSSMGQTAKLYKYNKPNLIWGETMHFFALSHNLEASKFSLKSSVSWLQYRLDTRSCFGIISYAVPFYKYQAGDDVIWEEVGVYKFNDNIEFVAGGTFTYSGAMPKSSDFFGGPFDEDFYESFSTKIPPLGVYLDSLFGKFGFNPLTYTNIGGFAQFTYTHEKFTLITGGCYDKHSTYGSSLNPRVSALFNITDKISLHGAFNTAFKAPTPYHIYASVAIPVEENGKIVGIDYWTVPNTNLEPEKLTSYELGIRGIITPQISFEISGFRNEISGLISYIKNVKFDRTLYCTLRDSVAATWTNDKNALSILYGLNFILNFREIVKPIHLNANLYVSYFKGEETLPVSGDVIDVCRSVPQSLAKFRINFTPIRNFYVSIDNIYSSEWYARNIQTKKDFENPLKKNDGFYTMDMLLSYKIKNVSLLLKINNVFDELYGGIEAYGSGADMKYNPQTRRIFYGGITINF